MKVTVVFSLLSGAAAFAPSGIQTATHVSTTCNNMAAIDDAFGISVETGNKCPPLGRRILEDVQPGAIRWFQNAELKHGRISMVAVVGFLNQKVGVHFPLYLGPTGSNGWSPTSDEAWFLSPSQGITFSDIAAASPLDAVKMVPMAGWVQILFVAGAFEAAAYQRQWVNGDGKVPGDYGFDPLGFTKRDGGFDSTEITSLRMKEIKNGRVAMLCIAAWTANEAIPGAFPFWHP